MRYEFDVTDPSAPGSLWRVAFDGDPLPSGLPQCALLLASGAWAGLGEEERREAEFAVGIRASRTGRNLRWAEVDARGPGGASRAMVCVGPIAYGGSLHRELLAALPRGAPLVAVDPLRGEPLPARPRARRPSAPACDTSKWRVVGYPGSVGAEETPARLDPVVVDGGGAFVDESGAPDVSRAGFSGVLYDGTAAGPWPYRADASVVVLGPDDVAALALLAASQGASASLLSGEERRFVEAASRATFGDPSALSGWAAALSTSPARGVVWYAPDATADALLAALAYVRLVELNRCMYGRPADALMAAARRLMRAAVTEEAALHAAAGMELAGAARDEVDRALAERTPNMNDVTRARGYARVIAFYRPRRRRSGWS